jgi:hypothetical protein
MESVEKSKEYTICTSQMLVIMINIGGRSD